MILSKQTLKLLEKGRAVSQALAGPPGPGEIWRHSCLSLLWMGICQLWKGVSSFPYKWLGH